MQEAVGVGFEEGISLTRRRRVAVSGTSRWFSCQPASRLLSHPHTFRNSLGPNLSGTMKAARLD